MFRSLALTGLLALAACTLVEDGGQVETLIVDAQTVECVGEAVQTCLRVKRAPEADWELFYDAIEGFVYEPGFRYVLEVEVRAVEDPLADGSSLAYRLLRIVEKTPA